MAHHEHIDIATPTQMFFIFLCMFGLAFSGLYLGAQILIDVHRAKSWVQVPAIVHQAEIEQSSGRIYSVVGVYSYSWQGHIYCNDQIEFAFRGSGVVTSPIPFMGHTFKDPQGPGIGSTIVAI